MRWALAFGVYPAPREAFTSLPRSPLTFTGLAQPFRPGHYPAGDQNTECDVVESVCENVHSVVPARAHAQLQKLFVSLV